MQEVVQVEVLGWSKASIGSTSWLLGMSKECVCGAEIDPPVPSVEVLSFFRMLSEFVKDLLLFLIAVILHNIAIIIGQEAIVHPRND